MNIEKLTVTGMTLKGEQVEGFFFLRDGMCHIIDRFDLEHLIIANSVELLEIN